MRSGFSIKLVLGVVIGLMGLLMIVFAGDVLSVAIRGEHKARQIAVLSVIDRALFSSLQSFRNERSTASSLLLAEGAANAQRRQSLLQFRDGTESGYEAAVKLMPDVAVPGLPQALARLQQAHQAIVALRVSVDQAAGVPKAARDATLPTANQAQGEELLQALSATADVIDGAIMLNDPQIDELLSIKRLAWVSRVAIGVPGSTVVGALAENRPFRWEETRQVQQAVGAMSAAWGVVKQLATRPEISDRVRAAVSHANEVVFGKDAPRRDAVLDALGTGQRAGLTPEAWLDFMVPSAGTIGAVVDAALGDLVATAGAEAAAARRTTFVSGGELALALALTVCGFAIVRSRVSRPLLTLTAVMRRVAERDFAVAVPGATRADELGAMARAVDIFRNNGIAMLRLEAEAAEQRRLAEVERETAAAQQAARAAELAMVVNGLADGLARLAAGELCYVLETAFAPEYERLRVDFNAALTELQNALRTIIVRSGTIRSGTEEIATGTDDLAKRTEQQAAGLQQTAAALGQIVGTVGRTAAASAEARAVASAAQVEAERSGSVVASAVAAMGAIESSAGQIGQIIGVIDEIAFQTNLLALNAGVEAARAGESGRGFAVVASEVRALAQRSADAAKQIKALISNSAKQVAQGVALVGETGDTLGRIVAQVGTINRLIGDIAHSAQEQATGLQEINAAVSEMDRMTQQNAAMVEHNTAATHSLASETAELEQAARGFRIDPSSRRGALAA